jgi:hypothetical protein
MNNKTDSNRGQRWAGLVAVLAAVAVLTAGCGLVHIHIDASGRSSPAKSAAFRHDLELARCMHGHGEPAFPDPRVLDGRLRFAPQSPSSESARFQAAVSACRPLIPRGLTFP